jgi:hypothetical protein
VISSNESPKTPAHLIISGSNVLFRERPAVLLKQPCGDPRSGDHQDPVAQAAPPVVEFEGRIGSPDLRLMSQDQKIVGISYERALIGRVANPPFGILEPSDDLLPG